MKEKAIWSINDDYTCITWDELWFTYCLCKANVLRKFKAFDGLIFKEGWISCASLY